MEFCPTCGTMLLYELPCMGRPARFYCLTCPYVGQIESQVKIKRHLRLVKKRIDPIFSENDQQKWDTISGVETCPMCGNNEVGVHQVQIRSADEPMTSFFRCPKCKHKWREG